MTDITKPVFDVRRGADRTFHHADGVLGRFSFPFDGGFDLTEHAHGLLMVHNDDVVEARAGLDLHRHKDTEIVTWVIEGRLRHEDTAGHGGELSAGTVQRMSAGRGILHAERNADPSADVRVVQMWLPPVHQGVEPSYEQACLADLLADGDVVTAVSGREQDGAPVSIDNPYAALDVVRPHEERPVDIEAAGFHHVYVTRGRVAVVHPVEPSHDDDTAPFETTLEEGDALRTHGAGRLCISALAPDTEVLVWRMNASFDRPSRASAS